MYVSNPQNSDFGYLPFDGDQRLITGQRIYLVNDAHSFLFFPSMTSESLKIILIHIYINN